MVLKILSQQIGWKEVGLVGQTQPNRLDGLFLKGKKKRSHSKIKQNANDPPCQ